LQSKTQLRKQTRLYSSVGSPRAARPHTHTNQVCWSVLHKSEDSKW